MKASLSNRLFRGIERNLMIAAGDRVGVAVSGGADSVALLRLLAEVRERLGITLAVIHFDHALRAESGADATFVEQLARSLHLPFIGEREDVAAAAAANKWNLEDAARRLRQKFFSRVVATGHASRIAVAHTMDDQAETVLARLFRGTGPAGLAAIYPISGAIVRPLLEFRRQDLREYLRGIGQEWREDATNSDIRRQRAHIRADLLPLLERDFSPSIVRHLAELARLSREEESFWAALVEERFSALVGRRKGQLVVAISDLLSPLKLTAANGGSNDSGRVLTERLVRRLYEELRGSKRQLTAGHVEQVIRLAAESQSGRRVELPGDLIAERNFGELIFSAAGRRGDTRKKAKETGSAHGAYQYSVALSDQEPVEVPVPELGTCFRLKVVDWLSPERETNHRETLLDLERLREPLILRSWKSGDSYRPRGRRNRRKLKDMFVSGRVARNERATWPVLESCGHIVWAKGMAPAHDFCASKATRLGVLIEECKL